MAIACPTCTFLNKDATARKCALCGSLLFPDSWQCRRCTAVADNFAALQCGVCHAPRFDAPGATAGASTIVSPVSAPVAQPGGGRDGGTWACTSCLAVLSMDQPWCPACQTADHFTPPPAAGTSDATGVSASAGAGSGGVGGAGAGAGAGAGGAVIDVDLSSAAADSSGGAYSWDAAYSSDALDSWDAQLQDMAAAANDESIKPRHMPEEAILEAQIPATECTGPLVAQLRRCLEKHKVCAYVLCGWQLQLVYANSTATQGQKPAFVLCAEVAHFSQRVAGTTQPTCGWRNIQMLCWALLREAQYRPVLFGGCGYVPALFSVQQWLERAWYLGYDVLGGRLLRFRVVGTRKWIGAHDCAALLRSFGTLRYH